MRISLDYSFLTKKRQTGYAFLLYKWPSLRFFIAQIGGGGGEGAAGESSLCHSRLLPEKKKSIFFRGEAAVTRAMGEVCGGMKP